jgi:diadenosine tetraphosphate (Ap4A) HIT family hydrolase
MTLANCRTLVQYTAMISDYHQGRCPFCLPLGEQNVVLMENERWRLWANPFPHLNTARHWILAHVRHITNCRDITPEDFAAAGEIYCRVLSSTAIEGGGFVMRFGSPEFSAASVLHLHANIIEPHGNGPVQATLAKDRRKTEEGIMRVRIFEKLRLGTTVEQLDEHEQELIAGRV